MNNKKVTASISVKKIIMICIMLVVILSVTAIATTAKLNNIKIKFSNNYEITIFTSKTKVVDILNDNHIILEEDETVLPTLEENVGENKTIVITKIGREPIKKSDSVNEVISKESIIAQYENITEKIVTIIEEIPFETITKDASRGSVETANKVIQYGRKGKRKVTYKITYKDNVEINREEISSEIIKEPVNKIVQIVTKTVTSRSKSLKSIGTYGKSGIYKVTAYCPCMKCCGKTNGITSSGKKATAKHTIAAPSVFPFGTKLKINGQIYVVEDRGGAIHGNRIDVFMNTHQEALNWGVKYLEVEVID